MAPRKSNPETNVAVAEKEKTSRKASPVKSRFEQNLTGKSTYKCASCGKNTRETGLGESGTELCAYCYEEAGLENSLSDGHITQEQFDEQVAELKRIHKRTARKTPQVEPIEGVTPLGLSEQPIEAPAPVTESNEAAEEHAEPVPAAEAKPSVKKPAAKKPEKAQIVKGWCSKLDKAGNPCKMPALRGTDPMTCYNHTPAEARAAMGHKAPSYGEPKQARWPSATFEGVKVTVTTGKQTIAVGDSVTVKCRIVDGKPVLEVIG